MAIRPLIEFFQGTIAFARVDESEMNDDSEAQRIVAYHRRIVRASVGCGVIGPLSGLFTGIPELIQEGGAKTVSDRIPAYLLLPAISAIAGILFGFSLGCLFASRDYLKAPLGQRLMKIMGTNSVIVARLVSLIVAALSLGFLVGPTFMHWIRG